MSTFERSLRWRLRGVSLALIALIAAACGGSATGSPVAPSASSAPASAAASASAGSPSASTDAAYSGPPATLEYSIWGDPAEIKNQQAIVRPSSVL